MAGMGVFSHLVAIHFSNLEERDLSVCSGL
jgi:hypothetical protein